VPLVACGGEDDLAAQPLQRAYQGDAAGGMAQPPVQGAYQDAFGRGCGQSFFFTKVAKYCTLIPVKVGNLPYAENRPPRDFVVYFGGSFVRRMRCFEEQQLRMSAHTHHRQDGPLKKKWGFFLKLCGNFERV
jgi:hypothetical protein